MLKPARKEFSAGGVVYKKAGEKTEVVLISRRNAWCLPKGKIEPGESPEGAAVREISEEAGIKVSVIKLLDDIFYKFISPADKAQVSKRVRFFLCKYLEGDLLVDKTEVDETGWFDIKKALKVMSYPSEKFIMRKAAKSGMLKGGAQ